VICSAVAGPQCVIGSDDVLKECAKIARKVAAMRM
jgi:hypothetical protein